MQTLDEVLPCVPLTNLKATKVREHTGVRVLLVDDNWMMREGLRVLLTGVPDIEVVGEASDGPTAIELVRTLFPDVVVMDVMMPVMNGIEATRLIRAEHEHVRVVAVSAHLDKRYVQHMIGAGACAYVLKSTAHDELVGAVRTATLGTIFLSPQISGSNVKGSTNFDPLDEVSA